MDEDFAAIAQCERNAIAIAGCQNANTCCSIQGIGPTVADVGAWRQFFDQANPSVKTKNRFDMNRAQQ